MANKIKFVTLWLCLICVVVFGIQNIIPGFIETFMLTSSALVMPWQFLTSVFLHATITHILYNLFALAIFGIILESLIGSKKFFWLFIIAGTMANLISFYWYPNALGASGAIMAVMGCLAILRPKMTVWAFNLPMPMFIAAIIWAAGSFLGIFGVGDQGIGYLAHLSGISIGVLYGFYLRSRYPKANDSAPIPRIILHEESMRRWEDENLR